jgi:hypothetical protein
MLDQVHARHAASVAGRNTGARQKIVAATTALGELPHQVTAIVLPAPWT